MIFPFLIGCVYILISGIYEIWRIILKLPLVNKLIIFAPKWSLNLFEALFLYVSGILSDGLFLASFEVHAERVASLDTLSVLNYLRSVLWGCNGLMGKLRLLPLKGALKLSNIWIWLKREILQIFTFIIGSFLHYLLDLPDLFDGPRLVDRAGHVGYMIRWVHHSVEYLIHLRLLLVLLDHRRELMRALLLGAEGLDVMSRVL